MLYSTKRKFITSFTFTCPTVVFMTVCTVSMQHFFATVHLNVCTVIIGLIIIIIINGACLGQSYYLFAMKLILES